MCAGRGCLQARGCGPPLQRSHAIGLACRRGRLGPRIGPARVALEGAVHGWQDSCQPRPPHLPCVPRPQPMEHEEQRPLAAYKQTEDELEDKGELADVRRGAGEAKPPAQAEESGEADCSKKELPEGLRTPCHIQGATRAPHEGDDDDDKDHPVEE